VDNDGARQAFSTGAWREASDAVATALGGVSVAVVDASSGPISSTGPTPLCDAVCRNPAGPSFACLASWDGGPEGPSVPIHGVCDGGMLCVVAPVRLDGRIAALAIVTGYVGSEDERARILERMLSAGGTDDDGRDFASAMPVLVRERADASARLVASRAELTLRDHTDERRREGRRREVSLLSEVARDLGAGALVYDRIPGEALATVLRLTEGESARLTLVRPGGVL
jgi:hypothetical protein